MTQTRGPLRAARADPASAWNPLNSPDFAVVDDDGAVRHNCARSELRAVDIGVGADHTVAADGRAENDRPCTDPHIGAERGLRRDLPRKCSTMNRNVVTERIAVADCQAR